MHLPGSGMLNGKYLIVQGKDGAAEIRKNPYALGNAWFVMDFQVVDTPNEEIEALNTIDLSNTAVLDREFIDFVDGYAPAKPEDATIRLTHYSPRYIDYESSSSADGLAVFSEIYYPFGWKATIDGTPVDHYRVNYMLRALNIPAGKHKIHFEFDPDSVRKGDAIATICIIIMYLFMAGCIAVSTYRCLKQKKQ